MKKTFTIILLCFYAFTLKSQNNSDTIKLQEVIIIEKSIKNDTSSFGYLGKVHLKDIPYSVQIIPEKLIESTGAHNLLNALKTDASIIPTLDPNNDERGLTNVSIRGYSPNYLLDGLTINSYHMPLVENVERVETLNGLNSFFYGFSSFGGTINFVTKKPTTKQIASISAGVHSGSVYFNSIDLGGAIDKSKKLSFRFVSYIEDGDTYIKDQHQKNISIYGSLNYNLFKNTNLRLDVSHQNNLIQGQQNVFTVNPASNINLPSVELFDPTVLYGQPWTYSKLRFTQIGINLESKLSSVFTFRSSFKYGDAWWKYNYNVSSFTDNNGNYKTFNKDFGSNQRYYNAGYALVDASFKTFKIQHDVTFGYSGSNTLIHFGGNPSSSILLGTFNVSSPEYVTMPDTIPSLSDSRTSYNRYYYHNFLIGDRIKINKYVSAVIGLSQAIYSTKRTTGNMTQTGSADYTQNKLVPCASLVVKPIEQISVYASYVQGLGIGGIAPDAAKNAGEMLTPSVNEQVEIGIKTGIKTFNFALAGFMINSKNEYIDPSDSIYKQDGREIHQGIEFSTDFVVFKTLSFRGSFTLMDVSVSKATNNPAIEGKIPQNVPLSNAGALIEYKLPFMKNLAFSFGGFYCDKRPINAVNSAFIPSHYQLDAGVRCQTNINTRTITFNVYVSNLENKKYYASYTSTGLRLGTPRLFTLSAKFEL